MQSNSLFPIKQGRSFHLLDRTTESPPEIPHKPRRTPMPPQECEIAQGRPNQLEIQPGSLSLAPKQFPVPHHTRQVALLPSGNYRDSLRKASQVYRNTNFSTGTRGKLHATHHLEKRAESQDSIEQVGQLSTSTSRGAFPQQQVCERDPEFAASSGVDTEIP